MEKKYLTENEVNGLSDIDLKRIVVSYGDGQGDTYMTTLDDLVMDDENNCDSIINLYNDYGGNMVNLGWIEDNKMCKLLIQF